MNSAAGEPKKEVGYDVRKTLESGTKGLAERTTLAKELRNIQTENSKDT